MGALKAIVRWLLAIFLGLGALGSLISGSFLGALVMWIGCALIAPPGGAWLARKVPLFNTGTKQCLLGGLAFVVGAVMGVSNEPKSIA